MTRTLGTTYGQSLLWAHVRVAHDVYSEGYHIFKKSDTWLLLSEMLIYESQGTAGHGIVHRFPDDSFAQPG